MQISTQQIIDAVTSISEELTPKEQTLRFIRDFAHTYRVNKGQGYCLN